MKPRVSKVVSLFATFAVLMVACCGPAVKSQEGDAAPISSASLESGTARGHADGAVASDLEAAGRALEAGDPQTARRLMGPEEETAQWRYLGAKVASALGEHEEAVRLLGLLAGAREDLEADREAALVEALAEAGRHGEAADAALSLLSSAPSLRPKEALRLGIDRGRWLASAGRLEESAAALTELARKAGDARDEVDFELAKVLLAAEPNSKEHSRGLEILSRLALEAKGAGVMAEAEASLETAGASPKWTRAQRLARARTLMERRAWDMASAQLEAVLEGEDDALAKEARWERARLLFDRRRHYREAVSALDAIIAEGGARADDARFLRARALSRLDRDREAIEAYRGIARRAKKGPRADEARFQACRLEFYLGEHRAALAGLEKLVGDGGRRAKTPSLGADTIRDAHFIAGMSAILSGVAKRAVRHLEAASKGTESAEVLERNEYWSAVAAAEAKDPGAVEELSAICLKDPTGWYAMLARDRLTALRVPATACEPSAPASGKEAEEPHERRTLLEMCPAADFFAKIGLFRDAARHLEAAERSGAVEASERDWIEAYLEVDAPRLAVRRAGRGLRWPPAAKDMWKARAAYPTPFEELVRREEAALGLPPDLIYAIARKESLFDPEAVSYAGAMGLMQMMPRTYETNRVRAGLPPLEEGALPDEHQSIRAGARELAHLLDVFDGSLPLAVMAYNGGVAAVRGWLARSEGEPMDVFVEKAGFAQTRNYVRRVYQNLARYRALAGLEPPSIPARAIAPEKEASEEDAGGATAPADGGV